MEICEADVLAVLVNKVGDEFTLIWPKAASAVEHDQIVRFFFNSRANPWTETEYSAQNASALCAPGSGSTRTPSLSTSDVIGCTRSDMGVVVRWRRQKEGLISDS